MSAVKKPKATRQLLTPLQVDSAVNAVFTALTQDMGRPFSAGGRNVRSIVRQWCPLLQGPTLDMDVETFRSTYLSAHFFDRFFYEPEVKAHRTLEDKALEKFKANLSRGYVMNEWKLEFLSFGALNSVLQSASLEVAKILGDFDTEVFFGHCTHGPNATVGVKKQDAYLDVKVKSLDGTLSALNLFREYLGWNTNLDSYFLSLPEAERPKVSVVSGSRLSFVPKKFDSLRTMLVEPTVNQFLQQGLGNYLQSRLKSGNIELETQPICHGLLVRKISSEALPIATVDWSQASDRIWLKLCQRLLPSDWFAALEDVRSPVCTYHGEEYKLTMAGSMGCGFTFPLQTLLFLCLLRALARECDKDQFVSVFGDDCICDSDLFPEIEKLALALDWQVNEDKSFKEGDFRESCGVDAYRGVDCRPFFVERPDDVTTKSALASWAYGVFNGLAQRTTGYPIEAREAWLLSFFEEHGLGRIYFVPPRFSEKSGVRCTNPHQIMLKHPGCISGSDADGWHFRYLGQKRKRVTVDPEPYYLWKLMGKGVPRDFKSGKLLSLESESLDPDKQSRVPWKGVAYGSKAGYVHTWQYFID